MMNVAKYNDTFKNTSHITLYVNWYVGGDPNTARLVQAPDLKHRVVKSAEMF